MNPSLTRKFCSDNCKSAYNRKKEKQQIQQQAQQVAQQRSEINQLKTRPQTLPQGPINPEWLAADRRCQAQESLCHRMAQAIEDTRQERRKLTRPGQGFWKGAGVGIFLVVLGASYAGARRRQQLSFWVLFTGSLVLLSLLGGWLGNELERELMSAEEAQKLDENRQALDEQEASQIAELAREKRHLEALIRARDAIDPTCPPLPGSADDDPATPIESR